MGAVQRLRRGLGPSCTLLRAACPAAPAELPRRLLRVPRPSRGSAPPAPPRPAARRAVRTWPRL